MISGQHDRVLVLDLLKISEIRFHVFTAAHSFTLALGVNSLAAFTLGGESQVIWTTSMGMYRSATQSFFGEKGDLLGNFPWHTVRRSIV